MRIASSISLMVFEILIIKSLQSSCGSYIPFNEGSCDQFTNSTTICCYLSGKANGAYFNRCYPFERSFYYKLNRTVTINGYEYDMNCGTLRGSSCGQIVNPISYKDCGIYSTKSNSCCYYKYKDTTNCIWLGTSDIGSYNYQDLELICMGRRIKLNQLGILMPIIVFIIVYL